MFSYCTEYLALIQQLSCKLTQVKVRTIRYNSAMPQAVNVCVFRAVETLFTYTVPKPLCAKTLIGQHVRVPFGKTQLMGCVLADCNLENNIPPYPLKDILAVEDTLPPLSSELVACIQWFSVFYLCTPYHAYLCIIGKRKKRDPLSHPSRAYVPAPYQLTAQQQETLTRIQSKQGYAKHLIHGITGSGKTELYMQLAKQVLASGKQVIICCPEISLTPQFRTQFTERFLDDVVVIHSGLTPKQRDQRYESLRLGQASIAIGPRSAVFSPVPNLGLIVIDEEHDASYKQENHPRYYTHEVAQWRCKQGRCPLVLGSATPSITSYLGITTQAKTPAAPPATYSKLTTRTGASRLPTITVIDMRKETAGHTALSAPLIRAIDAHLATGKKVLLLLNRRGYAPYISCQACAYIHVCPSCHLSYTYHTDRFFRCHRCNVSVPFTHQCPSCQHNQLAFGGAGIQKIEQALHERFPHAKTIRLDKDTAKTAVQLEKQLAEFKQSGDILLGTQLIAKGHHIETITLVGVLGIDTTLHIPDFTAAERTFQLLTQVAGRAGRGKAKGDVLIQTALPHHYAILQAQAQDYDAFIQHEAQGRQALGYPPFSRMARVVLSAASVVPLEHYATLCKKTLAHQSLNQDVRVIGPQVAPVERGRDVYRWHLLIHYTDTPREQIVALIESLPKPPRSVRFIVDMSPQQLL